MIVRHKFKVYISGQRRRVTETIKRELRRRSAVEPVIGHAKTEHRMGRNYLAGTHGDAADAVFAAAGYNFRGTPRMADRLLARLRHSDPRQRLGRSEPRARLSLRFIQPTAAPNAAFFTCDYIVKRGATRSAPSQPRGRASKMSVESNVDFSSVYFASFYRTIAKSISCGRHLRVLGGRCRDRTCDPSRVKGGKKVYYADYRNAAGVRKRMKIGAHGKVTTEEARKLALQTLGGAVKGEDPAEERVTRRNAITIQQLCADYMDAAGKGLIFGKREQPKKLHTIAQDRARINRHIVPLLGRKLVRDLTRADVAKFIRDVTVGKTAIVERTQPRGVAQVTGGAGTATRATNFLGAILTFAVNEGIVEHNVAHGVKRKADEKRTRRLTVDEYRALGAALAQAERDGETWQVIAATRVLALTALRLGEVVNLKWAEVDEPGGCFNSWTARKALRSGQSAAAPSSFWRRFLGSKATLTSCRQCADRTFRRPAARFPPDSRTSRPHGRDGAHAEAQLRVRRRRPRL